VRTRLPGSHPLHVTRRTDSAIALVEVLVALVAGSIIAGVVLLVVNSVGHNPAAAACREEATQFHHAVHRYYERQNPHAWPSSGATNSVAALALVLRSSGDLEGATTADALRYLDGSQRLLIDDTRGWTYDFDQHTTNTAGCS
jgi:hypothetical protein